MNKMHCYSEKWVPEKPAKWQQLLQIIVLIYCIFQFILFFLYETLTLSSMYLWFINVCLLVWYHRTLKQNGKYVKEHCELWIYKDKFELLYPERIIYSFTRGDIQEFTISKHKSVLTLIAGSKQQLYTFSLHYKGKEINEFVKFYSQENFPSSDDLVVKKIAAS